MTRPGCPYVSRAGLKLEAALQTFGVDVRGMICCDFGSQVGGFVDCLLQHGAARVYAVDTAWGALDYRLRRDPRVVVCERTNALHYVCPDQCDLVTIDVGWTRQKLILPAARRCLKACGRVITLLKPQYEAPAELVRGGVLNREQAERLLKQCCAAICSSGWQVLGQSESPIRGHAGNLEYLLLLAPAPQR
jgi:23S rRNA (cytidine1920-2'-O)/16S rRNA (cytidine1409-2'-O)-methyltransferase